MRTNATAGRDDLAVRCHSIAVRHRSSGGGSMFDTDEFVQECREALTANEGRRAVREVVTRAVAGSTSVAAALEHHQAGITTLHRADDLTVLNVVWGPNMHLQPHNHRMWATIGIYAGQEDNAFFRREADMIVESGGKELREGDVLLLGDDAIHSVTNPLRSYTGALHVYGGDFFAPGRSQWDPTSRIEAPFDFENTLRLFEDSNRVGLQPSDARFRTAGIAPPP
jgi:predicted metal-dependent enzyme (double-stranded beta helix superfamily)